MVSALPDGQQRGRLAAALQLVGLLAAGLLTAQTSPFLTWTHVPVTRLVVQSAALTALAWIAGGAVTLSLYLLCDHLFAQEWGAGETGRAVMRTGATAVWFAPAVVLGSAFHPGALGAAAVLVHQVTRLLFWQWRSTPPPEPCVIPAAGLFAAASIQPRSLVRDLAPRVLASACLQGAAMAALLRHDSLARALFYAGIAVLTMLAMAGREQRPQTRGSVWRSTVGLVLSLLLAGGLTVGSLAPRARGGSGPGDGSQAAGYPAQTPQPPGTPRPIDNVSGETFPADSVPGVILWPEIQPVPTLIEPMPAGHGSVHGAHTLRPLSIPFSGEYWMYRWPYIRPPRNSFRKRGNPAALSFRTTDHRPLQMEAHHKLDQPIALACCSQIEIAIRSSDRDAGAVSLELVLLDTEAMPVRRASLGTASVGSAETQLLTFPVPAGALEQFNEFQVIFERGRERMDTSAKIAIERFLLIPR